MKFTNWLGALFLLVGGSFQEAQGQPWSVVNTGVSHTIIIPVSISPTVGGAPLTSGDYIGVFYDRSGTPVCGGYELWNGGSNISISAFGDDATTTAKDGFAGDEQFQWKVWRHGDGVECAAVAGYAPVGGIITNTDSYAANGISRLVSLTATPPLDKTPPPAPIGLGVTPGTWTNVNSFSVDWTDPVDPSGIAASWYKVGSVPVSASDGTRATSRPLNIQSPVEGGQSVYVWLEDAAGNKDQNNRSTGVLYYDALGPANGTIAINGGATTTQILVVTLNNLGAADVWSGVFHMRFSNDDVAWSAWEACAVTRAGWDLSQYGGNVTPGPKKVYVQFKDGAGNLSLSFSDDINFSPPDVDAPPAPIALTPTPATWTNVNSFSMNWTNPTDASGIAGAWYRTGSPPASDTDGTRTAERPFTAQTAGQGAQMIYVWLEDGAGNKDHNNRSSVSLYYDTAAPMGGTIAINSGASMTTSVEVTLDNLSAADGGSGLAQMSFSNDNATWSAWEGYATSRANWDLSQFGGTSDPGEKAVSVRYKDAAGNVSASYSDGITFSPLDRSAPPAPLGLAATPGSWTNVNSFSIDWTNPTDASGIAAAWYKAGSAPTSDTDGVRTTSKPTTVQLSAEGEQSIHVWLEDGAGNKDITNRASSLLRYDASGPENGTIRINQGAASTATLAATLDNLGATDAWSGVARMRFSNNNSAWSEWETFGETRSDWNLSQFGGGTTTGRKTVYVQYMDGAGNVSAGFSGSILYNRTDGPWRYTNTGVSHTIIIQTSVAPGVDGVPLTNGDYIGVFYDSSGTLACAGYEMWTGNSNISVPAFGNDAQTQQKDGYDEGEMFRWKIWRHADSVSFEATAMYSPVGSLGGVVTDTGTYKTNGISALRSLDAMLLSVAYVTQPEGYSLSQNYPNPFNPVTKIQLSIANRQLTIVKVFDVLGRDVATLVNEVKGPGTYVVEFDASDLASGVYFYILKAGEFEQAKRLLLLR